MGLNRGRKLSVGQLLECISRRRLRPSGYQSSSSCDDHIETRAHMIASTRHSGELDRCCLVRAAHMDTSLLDDRVNVVGPVIGGPQRREGLLPPRVPASVAEAHQAKQDRLLRSARAVWHRPDAEELLGDLLQASLASRCVSAIQNG
jgi:hypothetical protein